MIRYFKNFYKHSYLPRYQNLYGMEMYAQKIDYHDAVLGHAYGDYSKGLFREGLFEFDENGVFVFLLDGLRHYNPCGVAEYALICYGKILESNGANEHREGFMAQLEWLVNEMTLEGNRAVWYYRYPNKKAFISGISQGMIISALLRAYQLTKDKNYLDYAEKAYQVLVTKIEVGGVFYSKAPYLWWFEEDTKAKKILNGHIYSLLGVWDLYRVTQNETYKQSFDKGIDDIKRNINDFDLGFFTKYDAESAYPANNSYHYTHITLFTILFNITGDSFFKKFAQKFADYHNKKRYKLQNYLYLLFLTVKYKIIKPKRHA